MLPFKAKRQSREQEEKKKKRNKTKGVYYEWVLHKML